MWSPHLAAMIGAFLPLRVKTQTTSSFSHKSARSGREKKRPAKFISAKMPRLSTIATLIASLMSVTPSYHVRSDDNVGEPLPRYKVDKKFPVRRGTEDKAFKERYYACLSENRSFVETCTSNEVIVNRMQLTRSQCFCDLDCIKYDDCCLDVGSEPNPFARSWKCREVKESNELTTPIYVWQKCPQEWTDSHVRTMCEREASELQAMRKDFSYLQDIPVKSKTNGIFYRNVFCALCNSEVRLAKWDSMIYCAGNTSETGWESEDYFDFSNSVYNTRSKSFKGVVVRGVRTNCRLIIHDFRLDRLISEHSARLCKPAINTCSVHTDRESVEKCQSYTSFVYENGYPARRTAVYKNFHCALCNNAKLSILMCTDPLYPPLAGSNPDYTKGVSLAFLFDFNFEGDNNLLGFHHQCRLKDGLVWDHVLKRCNSFTCGALFERKGSACVPLLKDNHNGTLNNSCPRNLLSKESFVLNENGSVYIKSTNKLLSSNEYEISGKEGNEVVSISVCAEEGSFLLNLSRVHYWLSEITLSLSVICLILHLCVYSVLKKLRNCPGKILMSLSACLICGHVFLLIGQHMKDHFWICYMCGALTHFGFLSSFLWMNVMAYDIYRTFSRTQCRNSKNKNTFAKYSAYSWVTAVAITTISVVFDNVISPESEFRPKYGDPICWFNQRKGLIIFFIFPIFTLLLKNVIFFSITAIRLRKLSKETKRVKNFSEKERFLLHIKLTVVLGLTWLLGILAGILRVSFLWYPFIIFNGLQGVFIFVAFTVKKKIIKMLLVKFKIHSDSYKMGKQKNVLRRAFYSSLSNLSTLQTTTTSQLPTFNENPDILKAVRKINPDSVIEEKTFSNICSEESM